MPPFTAESVRCRKAQEAWARLAVRDRLKPVREFRYRLVERAGELTAAVTSDVGRPADEVVATDLVPVAEACRFLTKKAESILTPKRISHPFWLFGTRDTVHRRPFGLVGLIGTWNYPIYLNAVPILQAIVAGNGVLWKPSEFAAHSAVVLHEILEQSGVPADLVIRLPSTRDAGPQLAEADVDLVHFTGSETVGRKLAARLGERLVPSILELSGVDGVIVLADADPVLAARSVWYGATLNGGQTCLATRRAFVERPLYDRFVEALKPLVESTPSSLLVSSGQVAQARRLIDQAAAEGCEIVTGGGVRSAHPRAGDAGAWPTDTARERRMRPTAILGATADLAACREISFAPLTAVVPFDSPDEAVRAHNACPFGLGAAVFTADVERGQAIASQLHAGAVVVNDVIVPTANPATPFGGRGASGWGVTQGPEGLLALTVPQVVTVRRGRFRPHIEAGLNPEPADGDIARGILRFSHARTLGERWRGLKQMIAGMRASRKTR